MDIRDRFLRDNMAPMFAAGAMMAASEAGLPADDAISVAERLCKEASIGKVAYGGHGGHGGYVEETFWDRNKSWLIPALVGSAAFYLGADGERHGRADRGHLSNAWGRVVDRVRELLGLNRSAIESAFTDTPGYVSPVDPKKSPLLRLNGTGGSGGTDGEKKNSGRSEWLV